MLIQQQRDYVRELGRQVQALALGPEMEARRQRWRDVNALRTPDRSPVWCKPIGAWGELLPELDLHCADKPYRDIERVLRRCLVKQDIGDDSVWEPYWSVPAAIEIEDGRPEWGLAGRHIRPDTPGGAWINDPPVKDERDLDRLFLPAWTHNRARSQGDLDFAGRLFDGVMPVRLTGTLPSLVCSVGTIAAELVGLDKMLLYLALEPEMMHRLMAFIQAGILKTLDEIEAMGLLTENNVGEMYTSDSLKTSGPDAPVRVSDLWSNPNSQEFDVVSPAMWEEFQLNYERPIVERFGLISYGCCENLAHKIQGVLSLRNLRIFVCSAWTDLAKVVEAVENRYTIMWRQKASDVVFAKDLSTIQKHLEHGLKLSQGCYRQVVCRELQTLAGDPQRLHKWTALAKAAAEKYR